MPNFTMSVLRMVKQVPNCSRLDKLRENERQTLFLHFQCLNTCVFIYQIYHKIRIVSLYANMAEKEWLGKQTEKGK